MIVSIFTSLETAAPMICHVSADVIAGKGISTDRYATGKGFYTGVTEWDAHVTFIQEEPFSSLASSQGIRIDPGELRRNIVTRGTDLNSLIGRDF